MPSIKKVKCRWASGCPGICTASGLSLPLLLHVHKYLLYNYFNNIPEISINLLSYIF